MRARFLVATTFVSSILFLGACSSDNPPSAGGAGTPAPACATFAQAGTTLDVVAAAPPEPTPTGGTPASGTYVLTSVKAFTNIVPEGRTVQPFGAYTLVINGTAFEQVVTEDGVVTRTSGQLTLDGVNFTATPSCEDPTPEAGSSALSGKFTAEAAVLKLYIVRLATTVELSFTKQ
jgi:hypothetical protein